MQKLDINYGPEIDFRHCNGCGTCYENCMMDIFSWDEDKKIPVVAYPGECSFCCFCEVICPEVAIDVKIPVHHLLDFGILPNKMAKRKAFFEKKE